MNDSITPDDESSSPSAAASANSETPPTTNLRPPRSKVERAIVWTFIGGMLILLGFELRSFLGFQKAYGNLTAALEGDTESDETQTLTEADVNERLAGLTPIETEQLNYLDTLASRVDTYSWSGPLKTRAFYVYYGVGDNPDVVSVTIEKNRTTDSYFEQIDSELGEGAQADREPVDPEQQNGEQLDPASGDPSSTANETAESAE